MDLNLFKDKHMKMVKVINRVLILTSLSVISTSTLYAKIEIEFYGNKVLVHYPELDIGSGVAQEIADSTRVLDAMNCYYHKNECPSASVPNKINDWNGLTMTEMPNANEIVFSVPDESYKIGYIM